MKPREEGPHAINEAGAYMEDLIMEHVIGRPLADDEVTWHRNDDTLDNRRANLLLMKFGVDWCSDAVPQPEGV